MGRFKPVLVGCHDLAFEPSGPVIAWRQGLCILILLSIFQRFAMGATFRQRKVSAGGGRGPGLGQSTLPTWALSWERYSHVWHLPRCIRKTASHASDIWGALRGRCVANARPWRFTRALCCYTIDGFVRDRLSFCIVISRGFEFCPTCDNTVYTFAWPGEFPSWDGWGVACISDTRSSFDLACMMRFIGGLAVACAAGLWPCSVPAKSNVLGVGAIEACFRLPTTFMVAVFSHDSK